MRELGQRILFGGLAVVLLIFFVSFSQYVWFRPLVALALAALASVGVWEYYQLSRVKGFQPAVWLGVLATWFYFAIHYGCVHEWAASWFNATSSWAALAIIWVALVLHFFIHRQGVIGDFAVSFFGLIYVVVPLACALDILYCLPVSGRFWITFVLVTTIATDFFAYGFGRMVGRHKLAPAISPGKTIEGGIAGLIGGVVGAIVCRAFDTTQLGWTGAILLGLIFGLFGQFGDLFESTLKRDAGVKDSNQIPGLGGVLDVLDSLLVNLPLAFFVLRLLFVRAT